MKKTLPILLLLLLSACASQPKVELPAMTAAQVEAQAKALFAETVRIISATIEENRALTEREVGRLGEIRDETVALYELIKAQAKITDRTFDYLALVELLAKTLGL